MRICLSAAGTIGPNAAAVFDALDQAKRGIDAWPPGQATPRQTSHRDTALEQAEAHLKKRGIVQTGDVYAITCGEPMGAPGGTNMLKICRVS